MAFRSLASLALALVLAAPAGAATIGRFSTVLGSFDVLLYDQATPVSVANFVRYANGGSYTDSFFHRSTTYNPSDIQIVQGGGFYIYNNSIYAIPTYDPIVLEAGLPNLRGTIAMARGTDPNSATCQWYFNVQYNYQLDNNYAVFGRIIGGGLGVLDAMASVRVYDASVQLGATFSQLPLTYPALDVAALLGAPAVSAAKFEVTSIRVEPGGVKLDWPALSTNTPVNVERSATLASGSWAVVASNTITSTFTATTAPASGAICRVAYL